VKLDAADFPCHKIVDTKNECGCQIFKPSRQSYCEPINKKAEAFVCTNEMLPEICFENVVNERADGCGCHTQDCVLKSEKIVNKYKEKTCPRGYYMTSGVTPCNRPRDACVKCPKQTVNDDNCDSNCFEIKVSKDAHGCEIKQCQRKKKCPDCDFGYDVKEDSCGCKLCSNPKEILIQRRTSVDNDRFNRPFADFVNGFSNNQGDYWFGLEALHKLTSAAKTRFQLVLAGKRRDNGQWLEVVLDNFYVNSGNGYHLRFGNIVAKRNTVIPDSEVNYFKNRAFTTNDRDQDSCGVGNCASRYKGGWWWYNSHYIGLNHDQRVYTMYRYHQNQVRLTETKMSIKIKM